jgi:DNA-binding beta-propeller fold protein YncE
VLPSSIAVTADGAFGYVSNFSGDDLASRSRILKYDLATMTIVGDVLGGAVTHDLKISDDGGLVVASNRMTNDVTVVHTDADTIAIVPIDPDSLYEAGRKKYGPLGILIDSERDRAFVACVDAFQIRILSLSERRIIDSINIPVVPLNMEQAISGPTLMAYDPATDHLFVTTQNGNSVVSVHVSDRTVVADIPTFIRQSFGIAVSGDGSRVYAVCVNPVGQQGRVYVIDNSVNPPVLTDSLDVGKKSYGLVWRPE